MGIGVIESDTVPEVRSTARLTPSDDDNAAQMMVGMQTWNDSQHRAWATLELYFTHSLDCKFTLPDWTPWKVRVGSSRLCIC